jgi:hypothetical protein
MRSILPLYLLFFSCCASNTALAEVKIGEPQDIAFNFPLAWYDCAYVQDTLVLVAHTPEDQTVYHCRVVGSEGQVVDMIDARNLQYSFWGCYMELGDNMDLLIRERDRFYLKNLLTGVDRQYVISDDDKKNGIADFHPVYFSNQEKSYLVYSNFHRKFIFGIAQLDRQYNKQFLVEMGDGDTTDSRKIRPGRTSSRNFEAILVGDTLYAVWNEIKDNCFLGIGWLSFSRSNSTVFSTFDGNDWSKPYRLLDRNRKGPYFSATWPIDVRVMHGRLFVFWRKTVGKGRDAATQIFYKFRTGQEGWSEPITVPGRYGSLHRSSVWSAELDSEGVLHMLIGDEHTVDRKRYCTFDGSSWQDHGVVIDRRSYAQKLRLDGDENVHIFWSAEADNTGTLRHSVIEIGR